MVFFFPLVAGGIRNPTYGRRSLPSPWRSWQTVHTAKGGILPGEEIFHTLALNHAENQSLPRAANSVFPGSHSEYPYCGPSSDGLFSFLWLRVGFELQHTGGGVCLRPTLVPNFFGTTHPPQAVPLPSQGKALSSAHDLARKSCNLHDFMLY